MISAISLLFFRTLLRRESPGAGKRGAPGYVMGFGSKVRRTAAGGNQPGPAVAADAICGPAFGDRHQGIVIGKFSLATPWLRESREASAEVRADIHIVQELAPDSRWIRKSSVLS